MRLAQAYLFLALSMLIACASPRSATPSAFAKTPHTKLQQVRDTFIIDSRDTILLDAIGQLYHWTSDSRIEKVSTANQIGQADTTRYHFQNPRLGQLASVDFTNPIRPLLFYQDAQTVVWLNRNLSELRSINLLDFGFTAIDAVAYAPNEGLWLFASDQQKLVQIDMNGKVLFQSVELSQAFNQAIRVKQLVANTQQIAMRTQTDRLLLFGPFGAYRSELLKGGSSLHLVKDRLVYFEGSEWWAYRGQHVPIEPILEKAAKHLVSLRADYALYRRGNRYWRETSTF